MEERGPIAGSRSPRRAVSCRRCPHWARSQCRPPESTAAEFSWTKLIRMCWRTEKSRLRKKSYHAYMALRCLINKRSPPAPPIPPDFNVGWRGFCAATVEKGAEAKRNVHFPRPRPLGHFKPTLKSGVGGAPRGRSQGQGNVFFSSTGLRVCRKLKITWRILTWQSMYYVTSDCLPSSSPPEARHCPLDSVPELLPAFVFRNVAGASRWERGFQMGPRRSGALPFHTTASQLLHNCFTTANYPLQTLNAI